MKKAFILAIAAFSALNAAVAQDAGDFIKHGKAQKIVKENWTKTDYDFNGDGYDDFFVIDTYDTRFGIYINDKKGAYDRLYYTKKTDRERLRHKHRERIAEGGDRNGDRRKRRRLHIRLEPRLSVATSKRTTTMRRCSSTTTQTIGVAVVTSPTLTVRWCSISSMFLSVRYSLRSVTTFGIRLIFSMRKNSIRSLDCITMGQDTMTQD